MYGQMKILRFLCKQCDIQTINGVFLKKKDISMLNVTKVYVFQTDNDGTKYKLRKYEIGNVCESVTDLWM